MRGPRRILVDGTHLRGRVTGIERIALELFSPEGLAPHRVERVGSGSVAAMIAEQQIGLAARALADRHALLICPGYPPAPLAVAALGRRCVTYVHDTFLLTRPQDLSWKARAYMRPGFAFAARQGREFLANSETTARDFRRFSQPDATVDLLRPPVRDVFGLADAPRPARGAADPLRLLAIGTIEPRKAYGDAIAIAGRLNEMGLPARLDIVGRIGWGEHAFLAAPPPWLRLHHDLDDAGVRALAAASDALLCTSRAEGLGLPLLEVQHGGIPVIAALGRGLRGGAGRVGPPRGAVRRRGGRRRDSGLDRARGSARAGRRGLARQRRQMGRPRAARTASAFSAASTPDDLTGAPGTGVAPRGAWASAGVAR